MNSTGARSYIKSVKQGFQYYKELGDKTLQVMSEKELHWKFNEESNDCATIINHVVGNMLSRWTHFYTEDGEKSWRMRDREFEANDKSKEELLQFWDKGWKCLFAIIDPLTEESLEKVINIRGEHHTVIEAINRQLAHYAYHIGQMIYLAKMIKGANWQSLSIPKNKSEEFNREKFEN